MDQDRRALVRTRAAGSRLSRYRLEGELFADDGGVTYLATDPELGRKVAIRLLLADQRRASLPRFQREARALAALSHPNVVRVYDIGRTSDELFVVLELVAGKSLRQWLDAAPRGWREITCAFLLAGEGLAAAHGAGIVHRDFKLERVQIGQDKSVRVGDFGLARLLVEAERESTGSAPEGASSLGESSHLAPEQLTGGLADARSDIFSFCAALYQALSGEPPFAGTSRAGLVAAIEAGPPRFPRRRGLPPALRELVQRGLAADPARRPGSMRELLDELARAAKVDRRRWLLLPAAAAAIGLLLFAAISLQRPCSGAADLVAAVWNSRRAAELERAFAATAAPTAAEAFLRGRRALDAYAAEWARLRTRTCEATRVQHQQPEELLELRMGCLDQRRVELAALLELLTQADAPMVEHAVQSVKTLAESLPACAQVATLRSPAPLPADPALRARVAGILERIAKAKAYYAAARYQAGIPIASAAAAEARLIRHRPTEAEALFALGDLYGSAGSFGDEALAVQAFRDAVLAARAGGDEALQARTLIMLARTEVERGQPAGAREAVEQAAAILEHLGSGDLLATDLLRSRAWLAELEGKLLEAKELYARVAADRLRQTAPDSWSVASSDNELGNVLVALGDPESAAVHHRRAAQIYQQELGADHPMVSMVLSNLGVDLNDAGKPEEAEKPLSAVLASYEKSPAPNVGYLASTLNNLSQTHARQHDYPAALSLARRSLALREKAYGVDSPLIGSSLIQIGVCLTALGRHGEAEAVLARALSVREKSLAGDHSAIAGALGAIGAARLARGRAAEALEPLQRAVAIAEKSLGPEVPEVAGYRLELGRCYLGLQRPDEAIAQLERAARTLAGCSLDPLLLADTRFLLARALQAKSTDAPRALELARQAQSVYAAAGAREQKKRREAESFLAGRR